MFSTNFEFSTRPSQLDLDAAARLRAYIARIQGSDSTPVELSLERALSVSAPPSSTAFSRVIQLLIDDGTLRRAFRVCSGATRAGLKDFDSIDDVPPELYDYTIDTTVDVDLDNIMVILKINPLRTSVESDRS